MREHLRSCRGKDLRKICQQVGFECSRPRSENSKQREQEQHERKQRKNEVVGKLRSTAEQVIVINPSYDFLPQLQHREAAKAPDRGNLLFSVELRLGHRLRHNRELDST